MGDSISQCSFSAQRQKRVVRRNKTIFLTELVKLGGGQIGRYGAWADITQERQHHVSGTVRRRELLKILAIRFGCQTRASSFRTPPARLRISLSAVTSNALCAIAEATIKRSAGSR